MSFPVWAERRVPDNKTSMDVRSEWGRDYARIVHSSAFRRLQAKTQVLGLGDSDFYRTRLTHSMEVAQIGTGILHYLRRSPSKAKGIENEALEALPDNALMNSICLAHDLGHPPFGHGGEVALNICMRGFGGFEGNGQTLRILSKLEKYSENSGLNPTRRLLLGILKYPAAYSDLVQKDAYGELTNQKWQADASKQKPPKCYLDDERDVVEWIFEPFTDIEKINFIKLSSSSRGHLKTIYKSLDTSIMDLADDISYGVHDLEDAIALELITHEDWRKHFESKNTQEYLKTREQGYCFEELTESLFSGQSYRLKKAIGYLVHLFISSTYLENSQIPEATTPLLKWQASIKKEARALLKDIFNLVEDKVIKSPSVQQLEFKGQKIIIELFEVLNADPKRLLPTNTKDRYLKVECEKARKRIICDFIAGMTDEYATRLYERLYSPTKGSVFDRL